MKSFTKPMGRLLISLVVFAALLSAALMLGPLYTMPYHFQYILRFLTVFPAIWVGVELTRFVMQLDELQQRLLLEALAFGLSNTFLVCFAIGMLQPSFGWSISMAWVLPIGALFCGFGYLYARRGYHEE